MDGGTAKLVKILSSFTHSLREGQRGRGVHGCELGQTHKQTGTAPSAGYHNARGAAGKKTAPSAKSSRDDAEEVLVDGADAELPQCLWGLGGWAGRGIPTSRQWTTVPHTARSSPAAAALADPPKTPTDTQPPPMTRLDHPPQKKVNSQKVSSTAPHQLGRVRAHADDAHAHLGALLDAHAVEARDVRRVGGGRVLVVLGDELSFALYCLCCIVVWVLMSHC